MPLSNLIAHQAGVLSRDQALTAGLGAGDVDRLLRLRRWRPVHPGVYLTGARGLDDETRVRAAVLWGGPGAVLAGPAAAWWLGLVPRAPAEVALLVPEPVRPRPGIRTRPGPAAPGDVVEHRGLPVTAPALTVLLAAPELGAARLDRLLRGPVPLPAVHAAHQRNRHLPGAAAGARALAATAGRSAVAAEEALVRLLCAARVGGWRRGLLLHGRRVPIVFPAARVLVAPIGFDSPRPPGWTVVRLSWADLDGNPSRPPAALAAALTRTPDRSHTGSRSGTPVATGV